MKLLKLIFYAAYITCFVGTGNMHAAAPIDGIDAIRGARISILSANSWHDACSVSGECAVFVKNFEISSADDFMDFAAAPLVHTYNTFPVHSIFQGNTLGVFALKLPYSSRLGELLGDMLADPVHPNDEVFISFVHANKSIQGNSLLFRPQYIYLPGYRYESKTVEGTFKGNMFENGHMVSIRQSKYKFMIHPITGNRTAFSPKENEIIDAAGNDIPHNPSVSRVICYTAKMSDGRSLKGIILLLNHDDSNIVFSELSKSGATFGSVIDAMYASVKKGSFSGISELLFRENSGLLASFVAPQTEAIASYVDETDMTPVARPVHRIIEVKTTPVAPQTEAIASHVDETDMAPVARPVRRRIEIKTTPSINK